MQCKPIDQTLHINVPAIQKETDGHTDRRTDSQTDKQTDDRKETRHADERMDGEKEGEVRKFKGKGFWGGKVRRGRAEGQGLFCQMPQMDSLPTLNIIPVCRVFHYLIVTLTYA